MSWLGKVLGGGLGFTLGGPFGALLGAMIGHYAMDSGSLDNESLSLDDQRHSIFFLATFSMLGKLSKADGLVTRDEIDVVETLMTDNLKLSPDAREFAIRIFTTAKDTNETFEDYAEQFYEEFQGHPEVLASLLDLLLRLAHADGVLHPEEHRMIQEAVTIFGIEHEFKQLKARYSDSNDLERCYEVLGATTDESLAEVKRKYRKLAMTYHPDRVQANGLSPELAATAEERFKEIQQSFDVIERHLGGNG